MGSIQKRGDTYRALVRKKGHPTISKTFPKKSLAQRWITKVEHDIAAGEWREDQQTFGNMVRRYITEIGAIRKFGRGKVAVLKRLEADLGHFELREMTTQALTQWATSRTAGPSTVMQDMIYIGVVLQTSEAMWGAQPKIDDYKQAMVALKRLGVIAESQERDRRVSDKEVALILEHTNTVFPMDDLIWFSVHTAMRLGEVTRIRWSDLSEDGRTVIIRQRKHPKQKRDQRVPLLPEAVEIIKRQPRTADEIFPYNGRSIGHAFQRARDAAGLADIRWHDLRHEGVSRLFERGLDTMRVAVFSGHRDMNQLRRYTHLSPEQILDSL